MERAKDRRVQAMFTVDEFELLADHAARTGKSISSIVREAVEEHLIKELRRRHRLEAAQWLCSGGDEFAAKDWAEMEADLEKSRYEGCR
ncbi:MAG: ribbon-helix-helix protein, CopG family [Chloroflexi bacterium]|nr:ribbon-helix-helix protein, CopG family [Chloroflexota bacterium]